MWIYIGTQFYYFLLFQLYNSTIVNCECDFISVHITFSALGNMALPFLLQVDVGLVIPRLLQRPDEVEVLAPVPCLDVNIGLNMMVRKQ